MSNKQINSGKTKKYRLAIINQIYNPENNYKYDEYIILNKWKNLIKILKI